MVENLSVEKILEGFNPAENLALLSPLHLSFCISILFVLFSSLSLSLFLLFIYLTQKKKNYGKWWRIYLLRNFWKDSILGKLIFPNF
jgi:hypothetical protein